MTDRDLTSDPAAERLADPPRDEVRLATADVRSGGDARRAPHSLHQAELEPDDEPSASGDDWDDVERL